MASSSYSASPTTSFLLDLFGNKDLRKVTIVEDNARSSGIAWQRQWYRSQSSAAKSPYHHPLPPLNRDSRWSSSSSSAENTERWNSPRLRNYLEHFVDRGLFEMGQRVPQEATTQLGGCNNNGPAGYYVLPRLCSEIEDSPGSPRLPTRRAFIDVEQAIHLTALEACAGNKEHDDDNDHNLGTRSWVATKDLDASRLNENHPKSVEENDQLRNAGRDKSGNSALKGHRYADSWNGHYSSLKNSAKLPRITATRSKSRSLAMSCRKVSSEVDRIVRDVNISSHTSWNESVASIDSILLPPVRRESWKDEQEQEEGNVCSDEKVVRRHLCVAHSL
jgi:hypothetical protein